MRMVRILYLICGYRTEDIPHAPPFIPKISISYFETYTGESSTKQVYLFFLISHGPVYLLFSINK